MIEAEIDNIVKILGDDMLSMEEKDRLIETIKDTNNDKRVLKKWMALEKAKMVYENDIEYAKEEGREEGAETKELEVIKNMLLEGIDHSVVSKVTGKTREEIKNIEKEL